jgi:hypothetical protein
MVLERELPVGALDVLLAGIPLDAEHVVVVPLAHALATFTMAGLSRRPPIVYPRRNCSMTSPSRCAGLASVRTAW